MALGVQESQGGGEAVADKAGSGGMLGQLGAVKSPARSASIRGSAVFATDKRVGTQVDLLAYLVCHRSGVQFSSTIAAEH